MNEIRLSINEDLEAKIETLKTFLKISKSTELIRNLITDKYQELKKLGFFNQGQINNKIQS